MIKKGSCVFTRHALFFLENCDKITMISLYMGKENQENITYQPKEETSGEKQTNAPERLLAITGGEAAETAEKAEKFIKERPSSGIMRGEFRDWWKGKGSAEGAEKRAEWVFDHLWRIGQEFWRKPKEELDVHGLGKFTETLEPYLRMVVGEIIEHGAQEDIWSYFWEKWAQEKPQESAQQVWKIYLEYLEEGSKAGDSEKKRKTPEQKELKKKENARLKKISPEEAAERVAEVEKFLKEKTSRPVKTNRERLDWWEGKRQEKSGETLIKEMLDEISSFFFTEEGFLRYGSNQDLVEKERNRFRENIEPKLYRLVEEVIRYGAQDDVLEYFSKKWGKDLEEENREKVWQTYQECLEKAKLTA